MVTPGRTSPPSFLPFELPHARTESGPHRRCLTHIDTPSSSRPLRDKTLVFKVHFTSRGDGILRLHMLPPPRILLETPHPRTRYRITRHSDHADSLRPWTSERSTRVRRMLRRGPLVTTCKGGSGWGMYTLGRWWGGIQASFGRGDKEVGRGAAVYEVRRIRVGIMGWGHVWGCMGV